MRVKKGRWSRYQILRSDKEISKHLTQSELLNSESLDMYINRYQKVQIMPCYGHVRIFISSMGQGQYKVHAYRKEEMFSNVIDLHEYLINRGILKSKQYYVIQPSLKEGEREYLVTMQRIAFTQQWEAQLSELRQNANMVACNNLAKLAVECLEESLTEYLTVVVKIIIDQKGQAYVADIQDHPPSSKWTQYQVLNGTGKDLYLVPETQLFDESSFFYLLQKHKQIFIKPTIGQLGLGIAQVTLKENNVYKVHSGRVTKEISGKKHLIDYLLTNYILKNHYLVQQKIPLAKIEGNPIDIRVITQWDPDFDNWSVNGKLVKIAQKGYVVTNVARELLLLDEALMRGAIGNAQNIEDEINRACIDMSRRLHKNFPTITIIGFDLGVDQQGHIWFIEANLKPDIFMFYRLGDMQMYQTIIDGIKNTKALT